MNNGILVGHKVKIKDKQNTGTCLTIEKLWNMKVTLISLIVGSLRTVTKNLKKKHEIGNQKNRDYPDHSSVKIGWRPKETCCHSDSSEIPSSKTGLKNSQGVKKL